MPVRFLPDRTSDQLREALALFDESGDERARKLAAESDG